MSEKYLILKDTKGLRNNFLFTKEVRSLPINFGNRLIKEGKVELYKSRKFVNIKRPNGKMETISWGNYLKEKKGVL